ncbi:MAG TPA: hydroxyacid dehydrogenase [Rhodopila sp.]
MPPNKKRLVYFENWIDPVGERILSEQPDIDLVRLSYGDPVADNDAEMRLAHAYQIAPRTELKEPWFGDAALLARCPRLLAISSTGAGFDMVDVAACTAAGVIVCNQSGTNKEAVAEHALGLMLALTKKIAQSDKVMRRGGDLDRYGFTGGDMRGKTVGLVGLGHIGTRVAELCGGLFSMTVLACDPYLSAEQVTARGAVKVDMDTLLALSDFVSVHCPRSAETLGMFGRAQFERMKPGAYFINTARGGIHDEDALADALGANRIAGAGVDVFLQEPAPADHRLLAFENVIANPHIAGMTREAMHDMAAGAAQQWIALLAGEVPPRMVNPEAWPLYSDRFEDLLGFRPAPLPDHVQ